jgi:L-Ala-D/L-Glu epimerase
MAAHRGEPVYRMAFLPSLRPLLTMVTLGVDDPEQMTQVARLHPSAKALKLKLEGNDIDVDRVNAVRAARPDVTLSIDANEGWSMAHLERMMGTLLACRVALIEQPLPAANDRDLQGYFSPIPIAADESLQTIEDLDQVAQRYQVANIKLDKCGGLSAAMLLIRAARERGMKVMVGCMGGRSRAIQPAFIAAQWADLVDLDAPLLMASDTAPAATYADGYIGFDDTAFAIETSERPPWANASPSRGRHAAT